MKALCIGQSTYNFSVLVDNFPVEGSNNFFNEVVECGSGSAANAAYLLGKYGVETYVGSVVGDDTFGVLIKKELEKIGVHTEYMETAYEKRTPMAFTFINKNTKARTINNIVKENLLLKKSEFQIDPDVVYTDGSDYGASLTALNKFNNKITIIGAKNCSQEVAELCKYCKYIIATREFAEWATGIKINFDNPDSLVTLYSSLLNKFVRKEVIITLGDKGTLYINNNQIKVMPSLNINLLDTTGAGDFFRGAFAYVLLQNYDIEKAVTFANIAGGLVSTKLGTRDAAPELSDIMTYFNQKYGMSDQTPVVNTPEANSPSSQVDNLTNETPVMPSSSAEPTTSTNLGMSSGIQTNPTESNQNVSN